MCCQECPSFVGSQVASEQAHREPCQLAMCSQVVVLHVLEEFSPNPEGATQPIGLAIVLLPQVSDGHKQPYRSNSLGNSRKTNDPEPLVSSAQSAHWISANYSNAENFVSPTGRQRSRHSGPVVCCKRVSHPLCLSNERHQTCRDDKVGDARATSTHHPRPFWPRLEQPQVCSCRSMSVLHVSGDEHNTTLQHRVDPTLLDLASKMVCII